MGVLESLHLPTVHNRETLLCLRLRVALSVDIWDIVIVIPLQLSRKVLHKWNLCSGLGLLVRLAAQSIGSDVDLESN